MLVNIIDYSAVVLATVQVPTLFHAYQLAMDKFNHYYNVHIKEQKIMIRITTLRANAVEVHQGDVTTLFSYDTPIVSKDHSKGITLHPAWKYSNTTSKHRKAFLNGETTKDTQRLLDAGIYILEDYYAED